MSYFDRSYLVFSLLFVASLCVLEAGARIAARTRVNEDEHHYEQVSGLRDSLLVLLSLLVGFTFAMAISHFELRRQLSIDEANAIGTACLRAETLADPHRFDLSSVLRQYLDARLEFARTEFGSPEEAASLRLTRKLQDAVWGQTAVIARQDRSAVFGLFMQSVNEAIDLAEKRTAAREHRIPGVIWILVSVIALLASFTTGYGLKRRFWFPAVMMPLMFAAAVALIADLDSPTQGLIRTSSSSMIRLQQDLHK